MISRIWSRLLIHPRGVEGAQNFLENSANTNLIRQAKGRPGQAPVPTRLLPLKQTNELNLKMFDVHSVQY